MKITKTKSLLIIALFIMNFGFLVQTEGISPNKLTQESIPKLEQTSSSVERSTGQNDRKLVYNKNDWELESLNRETSPLEKPIGKVDSPSFSTTATQYVSHTIIQIDGNADFIAYNFTGNGIVTNPYKIENLNISASHTHLIYIRNTDAYFEIRGNWLDGINASYNAVFLQNATNGLIINNTIINGEIGVYLEGAHGNEIRSNSINFCSIDGLNLWASSGTMIVDNHIMAGGTNGISVSDACNVTDITGNIISGNDGWAGIYLGGSYQSTVSNNFINYQYNGNGIVLGYYGMNPTDTYAAINNNTIYECRYRGIRVEFASRNTITKNHVFLNNEDGIHLYRSSNNLLELNRIHDNEWDGLLIEAFSMYNQMYSNIISNNSVGIYNYNSSNNEIYGNGIFTSRAQGIVVSRSDSVELSFNEISSSWGSAIYSWGLNRNLYIGNNSLYLNSRATLTNPEVWGSGIYVTDFGGIIAGNWIYDNYYFGIYVEVGNNAQIYGNHLTENGYTGISLINVTYSGINDNNIIENGGNGIFGVGCHHNQMIWNKILGNGGNGIFLIGSNYNTIDDNEIGGNLGVVENPLQSDIKFSIQAVTNGHGVFLDPCIGNTISNNQIYGNAGNGAYLFESSDNEILDNYIENNNENGVFLEGSSGNKVLRNQIRSNGNPDLLRAVTQGEISLKIWAVTNGHGVFLDPTSDNDVSGNIIENNVRNGIHLYMTNNSLISDNHMSGNENGLVLEDSNFNNISLNLIYENGMLSNQRREEYPFLKFSLQAVTNGHGVFLDPSDANYLYGNNIYGNSGCGVYLVDSDNTKIISNVISVNNLWGVHVDYSSVNTMVNNNDFYENNFQPGSQASDDGQHNDFVHNYWSDWIGEGSYALDGEAGNSDDNPSDTPFMDPGYSFSSPTVIYPNGGEVLSGIVTIEWERVFSQFTPPDLIKYYLSFSQDGGYSWVPIPLEDYTVVTAQDGTERMNIDWDTVKVANGDQFLIKVTAVDLYGFSTLDTSDDVFAVKNNGGEPTDTTTSPSDTTTGPRITPSWSYLITSIGLILLLGLKKRKKK